MNQQHFVEFFDDLGVADPNCKISKKMVADVFKETLQMQKDVCQGKYGVSLSEGLTLNSFKLALNRLSLSLGLHRKYNIADLVEEYDDYAHSMVSQWKVRDVLDGHSKANEKKEKKDDPFGDTADWVVGRGRLSFDPFGNDKAMGG